MNPIQDLDTLLRNASEERKSSNTESSNKDAPYIFGGKLELRTILPNHSAAVCFSRSVNLSYDWIASHPWTAELFAEHAWFDQRDKPTSPNKSVEDTNNKNGSNETGCSGFIWDEWNNYSLFEHATSAAFCLPPALAKKKKNNNSPTFHSLLESQSIKGSSFSSSIFPSQKLFADNFDKYSGSNSFSTITFNKRKNENHDNQSEKCSVTVFHPFTTLKKELEDILESRFLNNFVAGVPSPLSPDSDFFMDKCNEQLQEQWKWDKKKRPLGSAPPFCTCAHPDFAAAYIKEQNEASRKREASNKGDDKSRNDRTKQSQEEIFTPPVLKNAKGEALLYCPDKHCQGLLFVPYSFIEVPLHRDLDSLTEFCKRVFLPGDTELYLGKMRHTVIVTTNSPEHEYLCWKALCFADLDRSSIVYDIDQGSFKPFHRPVRIEKNISMAPRKNKIDDSPPATHFPSPNSSGENERSIGAEKKNEPKYKDLRIASFSWSRRPLTLTQRETTSIKATESAAKYWKKKLQKLKMEISESEIEDAKKTLMKPSIVKTANCSNNQLENEDANHVNTMKEQKTLLRNVNSECEYDDAPSPLSITEEELFDLVHLEIIKKHKATHEVANN